MCCVVGYYLLGHYSATQVIGGWMVVQTREDKLMFSSTKVHPPFFPSWWIDCGIYLDSRKWGAPPTCTINNKNYILYHICCIIIKWDIVYNHLVTSFGLGSNCALGSDVTSDYSAIVAPVNISFCILKNSPLSSANIYLLISPDSFRFHLFSWLPMRSPTFCSSRSRHNRCLCSFIRVFRLQLDLFAFSQVTESVHTDHALHHIQTMKITIRFWKMII